MVFFFNVCFIPKLAKRQIGLIWFLIQRILAERLLRSNVKWFNKF